MSATLQPPFLIVRSATSFWVETCSPDACTATVQAFQEGCYEAAWCYDAAGFKWPIVRATLHEAPSFLERVLPGRRVAVTLHLGPHGNASLAEVISQMASVLTSGNDFCEQLPAPPAEILEQIERATSVADVIQVARRYGL